MALDLHTGALDECTLLLGGHPSLLQMQPAGCMPVPHLLRGLTFRRLSWQGTVIGSAAAFALLRSAASLPAGMLAALDVKQNEPPLTLCLVLAQPWDAGPACNLQRNLMGVPAVLISRDQVGPASSAR